MFDNTGDGVEQKYAVGASDGAVVTVWTDGFTGLITLSGQDPNQIIIDQVIEVRRELRRYL